MGIAFSLILAVLVMTAISLYADGPRMIRALAHFHWIYLPLILSCTLFNYFWRFMKWQYYLRRLKISLDWRKSLLIYLSGFSMAITPGKVGEVLKSYLLKRSTGASYSRTTPILVADRLTDGVGMLALSATGLVLYRFGAGAAVFLGLLGLVGIILTQNRALALAILGKGEKLPIPFVPRVASVARVFYESAYILLQWRPLLIAVAFGLIAWSAVGVALYVVFIGLGVTGGFDLFVRAIFILAFSSLIGSVTGLPGGLGTVDGTILGLTRVLVTASATIGGAATLLIRLSILWFGLLVGGLSVLIFRIWERAEGSIEREGPLADQEEKMPQVETVPSVNYESKAQLEQVPSVSQSLLEA
jgi:uncharacterized protein (TIRG00374 family)